MISSGHLTPVRGRGRKRKVNDLEAAARLDKVKGAQKQAPKDQDAWTTSDKTLLDLPNEILQEVFIYSGNLSLPLTCRILHGALSGNDLVKSELIISTFEQTWVETWQTWAPPRVGMYATPGFGGSPTLQTRLLDSAWCSAAAFVTAHERWLRRLAPRALKERYDVWRLVNKDFASIAGYLDHVDSIWLYRFRKRKANFVFDGNVTCNGFAFYDAIGAPSLPVTLNGSNEQIVRLLVHPQAKIPDRLLSASPSWKTGAEIARLLRMNCNNDSKYCLPEWETTKHLFRALLAVGVSTDFEIRTSPVLTVYAEILGRLYRDEAPHTNLIIAEIRDFVSHLEISERRSRWWRDASFEKWLEHARLLQPDIGLGVETCNSVFEQAMEEI